MNQDDALDQAIGEWLTRREDDPALLPGEFAAGLAEPLRSQFLRELEELADLDRLTTGSAPRDLPLRFGDYRVLGELGRGAMGAVYAAEQISLGRRVALKVMHPHVAGDLRSAARFQREARTAASLVHPGIVPVLGFGKHDDFTWLAMGLVEGRSLQRLLQAVHDPRDVDHVRSRRLLDDPRQMARVLADAADALEFAHRKNVVHRDVKPANLMLGDEGRIVVLDFGLATAREADAPTLTRTGDFLGTPLYMAPEQAVGAQNGTPQTDVYALGAVLYECLCLRPPIAPGPLPTVLEAILKTDPVDPRRVRQGVPPELAHIAMQCLEKSPQRRYGSAAALADDLRRFVDGTGVRARGTGVVRQFARQVRRWPLLSTIAVATLLLVPTMLWAWQRSDQVETLQTSADLDQRAPDLLALSPEGITVFGGASQRFYRQLGLGDNLPASATRLTPNAAEALAIVERLAVDHPRDARVQRRYARVLLDIGHDPARTDAVLQTLVAMPDAVPADRAMRAVWRQRCGDPDAGSVAFADTGSPEVAFWHAMWFQNRQDYFAAIAAFDRALAEPTLAKDLRYFALLHRGWCKTCPDVCRIREAEDDLLQASALRPEYGTARLLWAALRCLDPTDDLSSPVKAVGEVLTSVAMEPWVVVLTARVLLALAEGGIFQAGPVRFGADLSPIAPLPLPPGRGEALASTALGLLDAVLAQHPRSFEPRWHRVAALALLGRHAEAIGECTLLEASDDVAGHRAAARLQQARVHLAAGRAQLALQQVDRALELDSGFVAAWRCRAEIAGWLGDLDAELTALERAAWHLGQSRRDTSVFPDAAVMLPDLQLRRAQRLMAAQRLDEADDVLQSGDFGGVLAGELSPRIRSLRRAQREDLARLRVAGAPSPGPAAVDVPADSPLRLLANEGLQGPAMSCEALAAGMLRTWTTGGRGVWAAAAGKDTAKEKAWLPATLEQLLADAAPATAGTATDDFATDLRRFATESRASGPFSLSAVLGGFARGDELPDQAALPLGVLLPHLPQLLKTTAEAERLLAITDRQLAQDADNGEARLVRAATLYFQGRYAEVVDFLDAGLERFPDDLRGRYVQAAAATASNQPAAAHRALMRNQSRLQPAAIDFARQAARGPFPLAAGALLATPR